MSSKLRSDLFDKDLSFAEKALETFRFQISENRLYARFVEALGFDSKEASDPDSIPLLPIRAFRERRVSVFDRKPPLIFRSSGTAGMRRSEHEIHDPGLYDESVTRGFDHFYPDRPLLFAWLPGYSENPDSSLVRMIRVLVGRDADEGSCFLDPERLPALSGRPASAPSGRRVILFGPAFGLLDLAESGAVSLPEEMIVMETGGMKTHRREMGRSELYGRLSEGLGIPAARIHSEYGMCEMMSQAYAAGDGLFEPVPWLRVTVRDPEDPFRILPAGEEGLLGIIDLANLYSCPFILSEDRGVADKSGRFRVLGRWNPSSLRGCNFLIDTD